MLLWSFAFSNVNEKKGAGRGAVNGFIVSTPQTGVDSFLVSLSFFSFPFAVMKLVLALILGLAAGYFLA